MRHRAYTHWNTGKTKDTDERLKQIGLIISAKSLGHKKSTQHKEHIKSAVTVAWTQEPYRRKHEDAIRQYHATTGYREIASVALTLAHADPSKYLSLSLDIPLTCSFCNGEINQAGINADSLVFHSLDGNHDNWDPVNKVPVHRKCHPTVHKEEHKIICIQEMFKEKK